MLHWKLIELECKEADFIVKKMKQINVHFLFYPDIANHKGRKCLFSCTHCLKRTHVHFLLKLALRTETNAVII